MILPITLTAAGACALINLWLAIRIGKVRTSEKISIGDGGSERLTARMRAQANFIEYTPIVLILLALVEMATGTNMILWIVMALFVLSRVAHGIGMDGWRPGRGIGTMVTMLVMVGLAGYALAIPYLYQGHVTPIEAVPAG